MLAFGVGVAHAVGASIARADDADPAQRTEVTGIPVAAYESDTGRQPCATKGIHTATEAP